VRHGRIVGCDARDHHGQCCCRRRRRCCGCCLQQLLLLLLLALLGFVCASEFLNHAQSESNITQKRFIYSRRPLAQRSQVSHHPNPKNAQAAASLKTEPSMRFIFFRGAEASPPQAPPDTNSLETVRCLVTIKNKNTRHAEIGFK